MSTPQDRDRPDDGEFPGEGTWREPSHLSGDEPADQPNFADRRSKPRDSDHTADRETWRPPGWDLPPAEPGRPADVEPADVERANVEPADVDPAHQQPPVPAPPPQERARGGLFGLRSRDPELERAFTYDGDLVGAQQWALQHGWTISDGTGPEDAPLRALLETAPTRPTRDHRPASVLRGRSGSLELVAFDVAYASGRYLVPQWAVTAAPVLGSVPVFRLSPARLWKHGVGGLVPIPSGNEAFDTRWVLLAAEDNTRIQRLAQDPTVHGLLLGTDDGDEFWAGAGYVAAIRPDGHRPALLEHHARLLTAVVQALAAGY
jgi:hypothetical protein